MLIQNFGFSAGKVTCAICYPPLSAFRMEVGFCSGCSWLDVQETVVVSETGAVQPGRSAPASQPGIQELGSSGLCTKQKCNAGPEASGQQWLVLHLPPGRGIISA